MLVLYLVAVVESNRLVCGLSPVVEKQSSNEPRASLYGHLVKLLEHLSVNVLEHGGHDVLLKGRQVLRYHAIYSIVLLPQLSLSEREKGGGGE